MQSLSVQTQLSPGRRYVPVAETHVGITSLDKKTAPGPFKIYKNCEQIALSYEAAEATPGASDQTIVSIPFGKILADIYGLTRRYRHVSDMAHSSVPSTDVLAEDTIHQLGYLLRRPVPSGGGLFPCELYLLVDQHPSLPAGLYHYDSAHHALDILRRGSHAAHLHHALARSYEEAPISFAFILTSCFWKNGCKYQDFSYRLQGLDLGVVVAQSLAVTESYTLPGTVYYQFLDHAINALLGLDTLSESVYAVITCSTSETASFVAKDRSLARLDPLVAYSEPLPGIDRWPLLAELHTSSLITAPAAFRPACRLPALEEPQASNQTCVLPAVSLDPLAHPRLRHSAWGYFKAAPITLYQLAALLRTGACGYNNDLDGPSRHLQHTLLYCVVQRVEGLASGVYIYSPKQHTLELVRAFDPRLELQGTLKNLNYNMFHVSVCIFPVAGYEDGFDVYGDRWYRIQNMNTGICLQRIHLAAAALDLGCQINLGYHTRRANMLLRLPEHLTSLAQVMIAPEYISGQYYEQVL